MTTTVTQLAQLPAQTIGYVFFIEGISTVWTDTLDLVGRGTSAWINTTTRNVVLGLEVPDSIETGTDLEENMLNEARLTVTLVDRGGELIGLIAEPERDYVYGRLSPLDDPAPSFTIGQGGDNVDLWGRHINGEAIGPAGERLRFPVIPGSSLPGRDHAAFESTEQTIAPSVVTDTADLFAGNRRCALYVIRRDNTSGLTGADAWPTWDDQFASGASLLWWGTVDTVTNSGLAFKLQCKGPESWLRRTLNLTSPNQWLGVSPRLQLSSEPGEREDLFAVTFKYEHHEQVSLDERCGFSLFNVFDDVITSDQDVDAVVQEILARLNTLASAGGPDETFDAYRNGKIHFGKDGVAIRVDDDTPALGGVLALCMHEKVWRFLGYDPIAQNRAYAEIESTRDIHFIKCPEYFQAWDGDKKTVPGPGYYVAYFHTCPMGLTPGGTAGTSIDNEGGWRGYEPLTDPGVMQLDPKGQQEISVAYSAGAPYATGQLARPVADHVMESGDSCDRTGWFVVRGQYRESIDEDPRTIHQVFKGSWVDQGETYQEHDGLSRVWIEKWLDPRLFGFDDKPIDKTWATFDLECSSLSVLGYNTSYPDYAHLALLRLMLSTGTKEWDAGSYEDVDGATYTPGVNAHPDAVAPHYEGDDQDIADLGLAIPHELVNWGSFISAANALPDGGYKSPLNTGKWVYHGVFDSQDMIAQVCKPRSYFLGLDGFKYSLFTMAAPISADDAAVHIGEADIDSDAVPFIPDVELSPLAGFDKVGIEYHYAPVEGAGEVSRLDTKPLTPRVLARAGNAEMMMEGRGLLDRSKWVGDGGAPPGWISAWRQLWTQFLADYMLAPHVMLTGVPVKRTCSPYPVGF